jgi:acyl-CoA synthetase (AMP-forming)/AMP-acid ligase II
MGKSRSKIVQQAIDWIKQDAGLPVTAGRGAPFLWGRFLGIIVLALGIFAAVMALLSLTRKKLFPDVAEAAVIGIPDDTWGEAIKALVVKKAGSTVTEAELLEYCKQNLASFKKPRSVEFVNNLPRSTAGKVLKYEIRAQYWRGRDRKV